MKSNTIKFLAMLMLVPASVFAETTVNVTGIMAVQSNCATITRNLKFGSRDAATSKDVAMLQQYLVQAYFLDSSPTGYFGKGTKKALQDFQKANSIPQTGTAGPLTRAKIKELSCKSGVVSNVSNLPTTEIKSTIDQPVTTPSPTVVLSGKLSVTPSAGTSPLVVTLQAPQEVMNKIEKCVFSKGWYGASGNGLDVDWGDGSYAPDLSYASDVLLGKSCTSFVSKHTYYRGGTYTIKVRSWHPGPTDAPVIDWEGVTVLQVAKNFSATSSTENLIISSETAKLDLKVNSSDGPVSLNGAQTVKIEWKTNNMRDCSVDVVGVSSSPVPTSGTQLTSVNPSWTSGVTLNCKAIYSGAQLSDFVRIVPEAKTTGYENLNSAQ